jgi:hypothetical protein
MKLDNPNDLQMILFIMKILNYVMLLLGLILLLLGFLHFWFKH